MFEKKKSVIFDQTFVNEEEDTPSERRKIYAMQKCGVSTKAVIPGQPEILCTRSGRITSQVTIKPQALQVRPTNEITVAKQNIMKDIIK